MYDILLARLQRLSDLLKSDGSKIDKYGAKVRNPEVPKGEHVDINKPRTVDPGLQFKSIGGKVEYVEPSKKGRSTGSIQGRKAVPKTPKPVETPSTVGQTMKESIKRIDEEHMKRVLEDAKRIKEGKSPTYNPPPSKKALYDAGTALLDEGETKDMPGSVQRHLAARPVKTIVRKPPEKTVPAITMPLHEAKRGLAEAESMVRQLEQQNKVDTDEYKHWNFMADQYADQISAHQKPKK